MNNFIIPENTVSERLGIPRKDFKEKRGPEGVWWVKGHGGRILWSDDGVTALQRALAGESDAGELQAEAVTVGRRVFVVWRQRTPKVLHVVEEGGQYDPQNPICVLLPRPHVGKLFQKGLRVAAVPRGGRDGNVWDFDGHPEKDNGKRFPRRIGMW